MFYNLMTVVFKNQPTVYLSTVNFILCTLELNDPEIKITLDESKYVLKIETNSLPSEDGNSKLDDRFEF